MTPGQSEPGSNGNERVLHIPQSSMAGVSSSDDIVSYPGQPLDWALTPQSACDSASADRAVNAFSLVSLF